ncbi:MAG TPA: response regulator [Rhizomicrobium sp.]|jgi:DNA-binding response OmpR family regulator
MSGKPTSFAALDVLVVEDEAIISFLVEDMLRELGVRDVWLASSVETALAKLAEKLPGAAILDVNLGGTPAYPVAEKLKTAGIPFVFASGYGQAGIEPMWTATPVIQKPFDMDGLAAGLMRVLGRQ